MRKYGWYQYSDFPWGIENIKTHQKLSQSTSVEKLSPLNKIIEIKAHETQSRLSFLAPNKKGVSIKGVTYAYQDKEISELIFGAIVSYDDAECIGIVINYNDTPNLTYGKWRRIDDFIIDALLSSPEIVLENRIYTIYVIGGWFQGKWEEKLYREFTAQKDPLSGFDHSKIVSDEILESLEMEHPKLWSYTPGNDVNAFKKLEYKDDAIYGCLSLNGYSMDDYIEKIPCLLRDDRKAIIFKSDIRENRWRDEEIIKSPIFTYLDENIFFSFSHGTFGGINVTRGEHYGFTTLPPHAEFSPYDNVGTWGEMSFSPQLKGSYLSHKTWRNFIHTLMNAWPCYKGLHKQMGYNEIENGLEYLKTYSLTLSGGFTAGITNSTYKLYISSL